MGRDATAIAHRLAAGLATAVAVALIVGAPAAGIAWYVGACALLAGTALYVRRLAADRRRMRSTIVTLRTALAAREDLVSDFERSRRTDAVTGLGNRHHLDAVLPRLVAEAGSSMSSLAVLALELAGLGSYREEHGEPESERALRELAAAWQAHMRVNDVLVRVSEEMLVAVLPACSPPNAQRVARRLSSATPPAMGCRIGVASWDGAEDHGRLLERAMSTTGAVAPVAAFDVAD